MCPQKEEKQKGHLCVLEMEGISVLKKSSKGKKEDLYHVIHKVPYGDTPYVKAKHAQLVDKDPEVAIVYFWKAINAGDKVDSALKDMAVVMKQLDRAEEAIEAIKSFRGLCNKHSQESLDNVLLDLYKKCGRVEEQIELLKRKLRLIYQGEAFNGRTTKTARSHGKKFQVSIKQETARLLGNLGWAYMQKTNYMMAEVVFKKAQMIDADANKALNLALCLMRQSRYEEAYLILEQVLQGKLPGSDEIKSRNRAEELLVELSANLPQPKFMDDLGLDDDLLKGIDGLLNVWSPTRSRRLPIFEEISSFRDQLAAMDEGRGVAGDDEVIGEAESEDDDPDYAHPVGLQAVLDSIAEMRMCMENMLDAHDARRTMIESSIQRIKNNNAFTMSPNTFNTNYPDHSFNSN
ncbi:male sterility MS5 family protein [Medicago truncatula]|uniref:Male sterility MS5 family protein n=1 Tax=Medicago truncatula TaxID=3880 RepID=G7L2B4_MEDTR|nr:male sterility MS5 family protein [Medicago truncatula]